MKRLISTTVRFVALHSPVSGCRGYHHFIPDVPARFAGEMNTRLKDRCFEARAPKVVK